MAPGLFHFVTSGFRARTRRGSPPGCGRRTRSAWLAGGGSRGTKEPAMRTISLLSAAVFTAAAQAQYSYHLYGMPDFDQKRNTLPGNGAAWCAPTAATDLMGYISNHGFPAIMDG